jgi:adenylate cyclase
MLYGYLFETRRRERLKEMFGQYVPEKHIDEMLRSKDNYGLLGEDRDMTVLFADIRNFTTISESLSASQLKEVLNEFFTPMTEIIFRHRGTIDKYIGDLIMAFWGAPLKDRRHAKHAINAALDMQKMVEKIQAVFAEKNWPDIQIGIGLNSGVMSVGDMGSKFRRNYTVLGDAVNLGSRIESLTKYYDAKVMVSETTQHNQKNFVFRELDRVRVKGKQKGIKIYEVICKTEEASAELLQELEKHHTALEHYYNQRWDEAYQLFTELSLSHSHHKLYALYLHRITEFKRTPPPENWDGVYAHANK